MPQIKGEDINQTDKDVVLEEDISTKDVEEEEETLDEPTEASSVLDDCSFETGKG